MNNDMLPAGMTTTIKTEDIKRNDGDLISRDALKNALNYIYDCAYIESKSKEGIASDIIDIPMKIIPNPTNILPI